MKNYNKIEPMGKTLEEVVKELLVYKNKNELVYVDFNGERLYSDKISMDEAYLKIIGKTYSEYNNYINRIHEDLERERKEHEKTIPKLIDKWIEEGHKVLNKDKWSLWDSCVPIRLRDIYQGYELKSCLDIVKMLNDNKPFVDIKNEITRQGHSGMSFSLLCSMLREFHVDGNDLVNFIS